MKIEADSILRFGRERTFRAYRDELPKFVSFLPTLRGVDILSREESGREINVVSEWRVGPDVPATVRTLLKKDTDLITWTDAAKWNESEWTCTWRITSHFLTDAVECQGLNRFIAIDDNRTRVEIRGELNLDLTKMNPLPKALTATVGRKVEQYLVGIITGSVTSVGDGLAQYLDGDSAK